MSDRVLRDNDGDEDDDRLPYSRVQGSLVDPPPAAEDSEDDVFDIIESESIGTDEQSDEPAPRQVEEKPAAEQPEDGKRRRDRAEERRRRREGRQRTFAENESLKAEVAELRSQLSGIVPRLSQIDQQRHQDQLFNVDRELQNAAQQSVAARRKLAEAVATADTDAIATALEEREAAVQRGQDLANIKARLSAAAPTEQRAAPQAPQQRPAPPRPLPPAAVEYMKDFHDTHNWMRKLPDGRPADMDTQILLQIDDAVANEGFDPSTPDYWDEIEERGRRYLPHRFGDTTRATTPAARQTAQNAQPAQRRGPMTSGASERPTRPADNRVYLTPLRKIALIDSGVLDSDGKKVLDKTRFNSILRSYQSYDRENGRNS